MLITRYWLGDFDFIHVDMRIAVSNSTISLPRYFNKNVIIIYDDVCCLFVFIISSLDGPQLLISRTEKTQISQSLFISQETKVHKNLIRNITSVLHFLFETVMESQEGVWSEQKLSTEKSACSV